MITRSKQAERNGSLQSSPPQQKSSDSLSEGPFRKLETKKRRVKRTLTTTKMTDITIQRSKHLKPSLNMFTNTATNNDSTKINNISNILTPISENNVNRFRTKQGKSKHSRKKAAKQGDTKFEMNAKNTGKSTTASNDIRNYMAGSQKHWIKKADLTTNSKKGDKIKNATTTSHSKASHKMSRQIATKVEEREKIKPLKNTSTKTLKSVSSDKRSKRMEKINRNGVTSLSDEIVADQHRLSNYKVQVKEAQALRKSPKKDEVEKRKSPTFEGPRKRSRTQKSRGVDPKFDPKNTTNSKDSGISKNSYFKNKEEQSSTKVEVKKKEKQTKKSSTKTLKRFNSAGSDELPLFQEKDSRKSRKQTETFKKYGVILPLMDEVTADQQQLSNYKVQVEEVQSLREPILKMPNSPKKKKAKEIELLDCKHLSLDDITRYFEDNIPFLSSIMAGQESSYRHRRYINKRNVRDSFTVKDLIYNTSTIVFSFEQLDHMVSLMRNQFDPDDDKSSYFFKVLAPELCLKIFMDVHDMSKREANSYLDNRPV